MALACAVAGLGSPPSAGAAVDAAGLAHQHRELVARIEADKRSLRRGASRATVAASAKATSHRIEAFAATIEGISSDDLNGIFLKIRVNDPSNSRTVHAKLQKEARKLRALALAMAEADAKAAEEAKQDAEGDAAAAAAAAIEEMMEQTQAIIDAVMKMLASLAAG